MRFIKKRYLFFCYFMRGEEIEVELAVWFCPKALIILAAIKQLFPFFFKGGEKDASYL